MIDESQMTLAVDLTDHCCVGWFASEKIFDCRVMWDGAQFWTRSGHTVNAPKWFTRGLPNVRIDGGIYAGREGFQVASNATRLGGKWFDDGCLEFVAFDFPELNATWDKRITEAGRALKNVPHARATDFVRITSPVHFVEFLVAIRKQGGEGGIFRNPDATAYETGRSGNYLRFKYAKEN